MLVPTRCVAPLLDAPLPCWGPAAHSLSSASRAGAWREGAQTGIARTTRHASESRMIIPSCNKFPTPLNSTRMIDMFVVLSAAGSRSTLGTVTKDGDARGSPSSRSPLASVLVNSTPRPARAPSAPAASSSSAQATQAKLATASKGYPYKSVCAPGEAPSWEVVLYALVMLEHGAQVRGLVKAAEASARKSRRDVDANDLWHQLQDHLRGLDFPAEVRMACVRGEAHAGPSAWTASIRSLRPPEHDGASAHGAARLAG